LQALAGSSTLPILPPDGCTRTQRATQGQNVSRNARAPSRSRRCIAFGTEPTVEPAQQLAEGSTAPQPGPIEQTISARCRIEREARAESDRRSASAAAAGPSSHQDSADEADDEDADEDGATGVVAIETVLAALEAAGVPIDRSGLGNPTALRKPITLPCGGKPGSTQRARLTRSGKEIVRAVAAAINTDGPRTAEMIAAALMPQPPLEERQRTAADKSVAANIVASYRSRRGSARSSSRTPSSSFTRPTTCNR